MADKGFKRKLTAILSADVEGYSRLMGKNEEATARTITAYREVLSTLIQQHNGNVQWPFKKRSKLVTTNYQKTVKCSSGSVSTSVMLFREKNGFMVMALTSLQDWKDCLRREVSVSPRLPLIISKVSCPMDTSF